MERRDEVQTDARGVRVGAVGLAATVLLTLLAGGLAASHDSFVVAGVAAHLVASIPIWLAVLAHEVRREQARAERLEARRLSALSAEGRRPIFQDDAAPDAGGGPFGEPDVDRASVALDRVRRGGASLAALTAAALELGSAWALFTVFPLDGARASLPAAAALCGGAFGLLVVGRYAAALGRGAGLAEVAAGGRRAASGALFLLVAGLLLATAHAGAWARLDLAGYAFAAVAALLGVEGLLLLVLELYRPRRPGEEQRPVYDSRLLGLVSAPADLARSIARTVDYQFGFAISQTWFYRFLERWVAPIVAFALLVLWALSSLVVVQPHERALVRRLGHLRAGVLLEPGASLKLPWPIDEAIHVPQARVQSFITGGHEVNQTVEGTRERTVLWTEAHKRDDDHSDEHAAGDDDADMLVLLARRGTGEAGDSASAVNLLATAATITYRVRDAVAFTTGVEDARGLLEVLAERELSFMLSGADLDELLVDRGRRGAALRERVQAAADAHGLGVEVTAAHLTELHPPPEVGPSFEAVTAALERREAVILSAKAHANRVVPAARAEADRRRRVAAVAARGQVALVKADAERFVAQRLLDRAAPGVFRMDLLLRALIESTGEARKIVVGSSSGAEVETDLDLSEKVTAEQLNLGAGFEPAPSPAGGPSAAGAHGDGH